MPTQQKPADTIGRDPPGAENGQPSTRPSNRGKFQNISRDTVSLSLDFANSGQIPPGKQHRAEDRVRKFLASSVRHDGWIPVSLRTLDGAQRELQHDGLALAISASEWFLCDLLIWREYPAKFARAEAWKHIGIGIGWVAHLRRKVGLRL